MGINVYEVKETLLTPTGEVVMQSTVNCASRDYAETVMNRIVRRNTKMGMVLGEKFTVEIVNPTHPMDHVA